MKHKRGQATFLRILNDERLRRQSDLAMPKRKTRKMCTEGKIMLSRLKHNALVGLLCLALVLILISPCFAGIVNYIYDGTNRLVRVEYEDGTGIGYNYDSVGNLISIVNTYTVTPSAGANGIISPNTPQAVNYNNTIQFTVTPNTGYSATVTGCGGTLNGNTYTTGLITGNCTVTASFAINTYTVTPSAGANGTISPSIAQTVNYNQTTQFTVTPNTGYYIVSVSGCGGTLSVNTYTTGPITDNCTVTASFALAAARIVSTNQMYPSLQAAYNAAVSGDVIQSRALHFTENLAINRSINVTCDGGYDSNFVSNSENMTYIKGMTTSAGTITIKNFVIEQ